MFAAFAVSAATLALLNFSAAVPPTKANPAFLSTSLKSPPDTAVCPAATTAVAAAFDMPSAVDSIPGTKYETATEAIIFAKSRKLLFSALNVRISPKLNGSYI